MSVATARILDEMEEQLMEIYQKQLKRGASTKWAELKVREMEEYRIHREKVVKEAMKKVKGVAKKEVGINFKDGAKHAEAFFKGIDKLQASDKWGSFFQINERKVDALMKAVDHDLDKAAYAVLRRGNDVYRQTMVGSIGNLAGGILTVEQATDLASKTFLSNGISTIRYANGAEVPIKAYAEMALRTANKRAYLVGEGARQDSWGVHTVQISQYGACSDTCLPWQGRVYIDDVYCSGTAKEAMETGYPLLSEAIAGGLFHPNCRHTKMPWFEGISSMPEKLNTEQVRQTAAREARTKEIERTIASYKRLADGSLDPKNKARYAGKVAEWRKRKKWIPHVKFDLKPLPQPKSQTTPITLVSPPKNVVEIPKSLANLDKNIEYSLKSRDWSRYALDPKMSSKIEFLENTMRYTIENSDPMMRVKTFEDLEHIAKSQFKNQIQLAEEGIKGKTGGYYGPDRRKNASRSLFGWDEVFHDLKGADLENYGYLGSKNMQDEVEDFWKTSQYGDIMLKFKRENVLDRSTFTLGDSLGSGLSPSRLNNPKITSIDPYYLDDKYAAWKKMSAEDLKNPHKFNRQYTEIQYHGKLTIDDVESVWMSATEGTYDKISPELAQILNDKKIPVYKIDGDFIKDLQGNVVGKYGELFNDMTPPELKVTPLEKPKYWEDVFGEKPFTDERKRRFDRLGKSVVDYDTEDIDLMMFSTKDEFDYRMAKIDPWGVEPESWKDMMVKPFEEFKDRYKFIGMDLADYGTYEWDMLTEFSDEMFEDLVKGTHGKAVTTRPAGWSTLPWDGITEKRYYTIGKELWEYDSTDYAMLRGEIPLPDGSVPLASTPKTTRAFVDVGYDPDLELLSDDELMEIARKDEATRFEMAAEFDKEFEFIDKTIEEILEEDEFDFDKLFGPVE